MHVRDLVPFGVRPEDAAVWGRDLKTLLPVQEAAVRAGLLQGRALFVSAVSSSGKTLIGEMAAIRSARNGRLTFLLVPLKAVAEEKFADLRRRYEETGLNLILSTRDQADGDARLMDEESAVRLVVATYEKAASLLVRDRSLVDRVGCVVIDEAQMLGDPERGPALELLLARLRSQPKPPQIVALAPLLDDAKAVAAWLGAELVAEPVRPVELRKGVLRGRDFRYVEVNTGQEGVERLLPFEPADEADRGDLVLETAEHLARHLREQVAVFLPSKLDGEREAVRFGERSRLPAARSAIDELREAEDSAFKDLELRALAGGCAFHNADLTLEMREIIERHVRNGSIRVLFSTSTLAMGVNLPFDSVIVWPWAYDASGKLQPMKRSAFDNMAGRAGRFGLGKSFGRAIVVEPSKFEESLLWDRLLRGPVGSVFPSLDGRPLHDTVLRLLAMAEDADEEMLRRWLGNTYTGSIAASFAGSLSRTIDELGEAGLVQRTPGGLRLADLGRVAAAAGLSFTTAAALREWCGHRDRADALPTLVGISFTEEARKSFVPLAKDERLRAPYVDMLREVADSRALDDDGVVALMSGVQNGDDVAMRALKRTLALHDWIQEVPLREIEERYRIGGGLLQRLGEEAAWMARSLAEIAALSAWSEPRVKAVRTLAARLDLGVKEELVPLGDLHAPAIGRSALRRLHSAGLSTPKEVESAGLDRLAGILGRARASRLVHARPRAAREASRLELTVVDGKPALVGANTVPLSDTDLFIGLLLFLARSRDKGIFVPGRLVHPRHETSRKSVNRLRLKLAKALACPTPKAMENNGARAYRLPPGGVAKLDVGALRAFNPGLVREAEQVIGSLSQR